MSTAGTLGGYGHSWAFGTGATRPERGFAALTARALGLRPDNRAVSGSVSTETATLVATTPPPPADVFLLMTGLNDARLHGPAPAGRLAYADALAVILDAFRRANPGALVLAIEQPHLSDYAGYAPFHRGSDAVIDAYNATLRQLAARDAACLVPIPGWQVDTMVAVDGVHAGDTGHRHLARAVVDACLQSRWWTDQKAAPRRAASELRSAGRIGR